MKILFALLFILLIVLIYLLRLIYYFYLSRKTWNKSKTSIEDFIKQNKEYLQSIKIGCSFAPEQWTNEEIKNGVPLKALEIIVKELKIKDIRLGIRWNRTLDQYNNFTLGQYIPYIDYCIKNKVNICLNIGPIKTFRWPEEYIPYSILDNMRETIQTKQVIKSDDELADYSLKYTEKLLQYLVKEYTDKELKSFTIIQPENEGFNRFGILKLKISKEYYKILIALINEYFPDSKILVNSAGRFQLRQVVNLYKDIIKLAPNFKNRLIIGYDYYYSTQFRDKFFLSKNIDSIHLSKPFDYSLNLLKRIAKSYSFKLEVTEAQFETWGNSTDSGNKIRDILFVILRTKHILQNNKKTNLNEKSIIRLWGIEEFAKKIQNNELTQDHKDIITLITNINTGV